MKLDIGPGDWSAPDDWTSVDQVQRAGRVDVIGSLLDLPFEDGSVEKVYCGHVMEHIEEENLPRAFAEIGRVLEPDGVLMIVGPDYKRAKEQGEPQFLLDSIKASPREEYLASEGAVHAWTCDEGRMRKHVEAAGFRCRPLPVAEVDSEEWPIGDRKARWQFAMECNREENEGE